MFAIIKTGGKQIKVEAGQTIFVELLNGEVDGTVTFDEVLMIDGVIGTPTIQGATVTGTILKHGKDKKIRVVRYHPKKNVNKVYGHRQPYTKVQINEISVGSTKTSK